MKKQQGINAQDGTYTSITVLKEMAASRQQAALTSDHVVGF